MFDLLAITSNMSNDNDIAYKWIVALFPDGADSPIGAAFSVFSTSLTFLGSLLLSWYVLVGIVSSAYEGKVLGQKWHQIWAPLRVVLGFGMLVPVSHGFSSVHYLLKNVIGVAAVNLGNAPIVAYINAATDRSNASTLTTNVGSDLARQIIEQETCKYVINYINNSNSGRYTRGKALAPENNYPLVSGESAHWLSDTGTLWDYKACGSLSFEQPTVSDSEVLNDASPKLTDFQTSRVKATATMISALRDPNLIDYNALAKFVVEHADWDINAVTSKELVDQLLNQHIIANDFVSKLYTIITNWNTSVSDAAGVVFSKAIADNSSKLKDRINKYGFMAAGSYERSLSSIAGLTVSLASDKPIVKTVNLSQRYKDSVQKALSIIAKSRYDDTNLALATGIAEPEDDAGWTTYILGKVFGPNISNMKLHKDSPDPIGDMITFGHNLLNIVAVGIGVMALAAGGSKALGWVPGAGSVASGMITYVSQWIGYILMICLIVGLIHSFVLPMLPMMMVFVMGVSWLVLYLEAAIAGILWAFAFIRMDGSEFFDRNQAPGVTLLFNLLLRPAIGMLAYCGMLLLLPELLRSLSLIWDQAYWVQTGDNGGFVFIFQWLGGIVLFTWMQWHLTLRITGLIPTIADRVGHWMGFSGMHGYNDGQEASAAAGALVAAGMAGAKAPITPQFGGGRRGGPPPGGSPNGTQGQNGGAGADGHSGSQEHGPSGSTAGTGAGGIMDSGSIRGAGNSVAPAQLYQSNLTKGEKGEKGETGQLGNQGRDGRDGKSDDDKINR